MYSCLFYENVELNMIGKSVRCH